MEIKLIGGCLFVDGTKVQCPPKRLPHLSVPSPSGPSKPPTPSSPTKPPTDPSGPPDTPGGPTSPPGGTPPDLPNPPTGGPAETPPPDGDSGNRDPGALSEPTSLALKPPLIGAGNMRGLSKPAASTTKTMPKQAHMAAELMDLFYQLKGDRDEGFNVTEEYMDDLYEDVVSKETRAAVGTIDAQLSNEYAMVYVKRNAEGAVIETRAVFRGASEGEVAPLAKSVSGKFGRQFFTKQNAAYDKFLEENHFSVLRKMETKYNMKPTAVMGHSMGANAGVRAVSEGLAEESVSLNPFTIDEMMQNGKHTIISTPRDPYHMLRKVVPQKPNYNPNITRIVLPDTTGTKSIRTAVKEGPSFLHAHSLDRFLEDGIPVEQTDSITSAKKIGKNALFVLPETEAPMSSEAAQLANDAGRLLERDAQRAARTTARVNVAKGIGANVVGALVTDKVLDAAGVENEEAHNILSSTAGGVAEGVLVTGEVAASAAGGLAGGVGTAEATYLADRVGVKGAGKVAMQVGTGLLAVFGFIFAPEVAIPMLIAGGVAEGVDAAVHSAAQSKEEKEKAFEKVQEEAYQKLQRDWARKTQQEEADRVARVVHDSHMNMKESDFVDFIEEQEAREKEREESQVREMDASVPVETY